MKYLVALFALAFAQLLSAAESADEFAQFLTSPASNNSGKLVFTIATAKELEIIALDPSVRFDENKKPITPTSAFHGFAILSTAHITDAKEIQRLADSLGKAIDAGKSSAWCFSPRHALRIKKPDGDVEVLVCFECSAVQIHGIPGLSYSAIAPNLTQADWEKIFAAHIPRAVQEPVRKSTD